MVSELGENTLERVRRVVISLVICRKISFFSEEKNKERGEKKGINIGGVVIRSSHTRPNGQNETICLSAARVSSLSSECAGRRRESRDGMVIPV